MSKLIEDAEATLVEDLRGDRGSKRAESEMKAEIKLMHRQLDILEEHLTIRQGLADKIQNIPKVKIPKRKQKNTVIPIAPNSDEHYDTIVTLQETSGINEQTLEIAEQKVHRYVTRLIRLIERDALDSHIPYMIMPFMGDMITGELHDKSERNSSLTPLEAARFARRMKRTIIDTLLDKGPAERIIIPCVDGNHGRTTAKRTPGMNARYSHETDVYIDLAEIYEKESRVDFYIPQTDFATINVTDEFKLTITHGDSVRGGGGIGGLAPSLLKAVSRWKDAFPSNLYMLGHFHQYFDLGSVIVNPSAIGYDGYAAAIGLSPTPPSQMYTALHVGRNRRAMSCNIWLDA